MPKLYTPPTTVEPQLRDTREARLREQFDRQLIDHASYGRPWCIDDLTIRSDSPAAIHELARLARQLAQTPEYAGRVTIDHSTTRDAGEQLLVTVNKVCPSCQRAFRSLPEHLGNGRRHV